jgi:hypothetical protein
MELLQSAARDIYVFMTSSTDHISGITGLGSALTVTMGKNGGALSSISPTVTERSNGWYTLSLTASHTDTQGELGFHVTGSGCDPSDFKHVVVAYNAFDGAYLGLTGIDELETRLTAARAGYLDELASANIPTDLTNIYNRIGAPAGASIAADLVVIDNFVDDLESRMIGTIAAGTHNPQSGDAYARLGAPAGASIAADLVVIDNFVDDLETRLSTTRAGYLDNLSAGAVATASALTTVSGLVDDLESRLTAARAGYLDELGAANIPADIDTLVSRLTSLRAGYLDNLSAGAVATASALTTVSGLVDDLESRLTSTRAGYLDNLASGAVALASELSKVLGATAGMKVVSADGLQVEVYDETDTLLVTLDRTGAGPYTWTPTWE